MTDPDFNPNPLPYTSYDINLAGRIRERNDRNYMIEIEMLGVFRRDGMNTRHTRKA